MTVVGEAFIEISPTDKGFEQKVLRQATAAAKKAAGELADVPVSADAAKLDASVVAAAKAAARKATKELQDIPGGVDAAEFERRVTAAANDAAAKAAAKLANIPAGVDVASLEADAANAAAKAATAAASRLDDIPLGVDGAELVRDVDHAMDQAERRVDTGARRMRDDTGSAMSGLGGLVAKSFAAIGVGQLVFGGVQAVREARAEARQTENVIRSTGGAAHVSAKQIDNLTASIRAKTQVDDDEVRAGANLLLTFTNVRNEVGRGNDIFNQATLTLVDMAKAMGNDTSAGAIQLGKALNDPIAGVSALAEVGVTFTAQQKDQIRTMVEAGNVAGAQKVILAELRKEFGGSAAAQADDLDRLSLKYDDFKKRVGAGMLQVIGVVSSVPAPLQIVGAGLAGLAVAAVGVNKVVEAVSNLSDRLSDATVAGRPLSGVLGRVGQAGVVVAGLAAAAGAVTLVDEAVLRYQHGGAPKVAEMGNALVRFGQSGKASGLLAKEFGDDFDKLGDKLKDLDGGRVGGGGILSNIFGPAARGRINDAKRDVDAMDKALAQLVATGNKEEAATILAKLAKEAGLSLPEARKHLDDYRGALAEVDTEQRLAAGSAGHLGDEQDDATASTKTAAAVTYDAAAALARQEQELADVAAGLDAFRSALDKAIGIQVNSQQAAITYIDTVQRLRDSVTEHGKTLDLNSDAGRRNREAILAVISSAKEHVSAMAEEGASADQVRATFATHRAELERVLSTLGLNKQQSADYVAILKDVPASVFTNLQVKDEQGRATVRSFVELLDKTLGTERIVTIKVDPVTGVTTRVTGPILREGGGPVYRGQGYVVGEKRAEWFVPDTNGWVYPRVPRAANGAMVAPSPGGTLVQVAEAGRPEAIVPLPPGLVSALERLATTGGGGQFRDLVVQGATVAGAWATGMEVVRQMRADNQRATGGRLYP